MSPDRSTATVTCCANVLSRVSAAMASISSRNPRTAPAARAGSPSSHKALAAVHWVCSVARARARILSSVVAPTPRVGTLTMRSKAVSSARLSISRR